ncbi:MAG: hypothetical protein P5700_22475 [Arthrospira platensis PCC 7345]|nr:hypothetical protein AP285_17265 [Arthrospira platensis YZ]KDR59020.1 hypothetical protein APPUASWS_001575 [Arthrospira platensis str. Paraca]MDT9297772.1 hypothetical protein [Arthrospira platensis PCC 7345]MDT9313208.1 hypothetical protein [Limnospira sp. Paracas R14]
MLIVLFREKRGMRGRGAVAVKGDFLASGGKETGFQGCCSGKWVGARNPVSGLRAETGFLGGFRGEMRG